jgi:cytochrome oxidase Cu insertion factor (SCO1/SenC/PrrC family)
MTGTQKGQACVWLALLMLSAAWVLGMVEAPAAGPALPPPSGLATPGQPTPMPDFSLPGVNGTTIRSADLQGKVVVVRFWATW